MEPKTRRTLSQKLTSSIPFASGSDQKSTGVRDQLVRPCSNRLQVNTLLSRNSKQTNSACPSRVRDFGKSRNGPRMRSKLASWVQHEVSQIEFERSQGPVAGGDVEYWILVLLS